MKTLHLANIRHKKVNPITPCSIQIYLKSKRGAQDIYNLLNKKADIPSGKDSWNKNINLKKMSGKIFFSDPFKIAKDNTGKWSQSIINHKNLATNTFLYTIILIGDPKCTFCTKTGEYIEHLL